jgi:hypothetical protein
MELTAQYWRPVWMRLEEEFTLTLAQARSTRARRGRKWDKADARRIAKRLLSGDLTVSYVPPPEQRDWRLLSRTQVAVRESLRQAGSFAKVISIALSASSLAGAIATGDPAEIIRTVQDLADELAA